MDPFAKTVTFTRVLSADEELCMAHLRAVLGCSDEQIVGDALQYVFRKLRANVTMSGSLLSSLEGNEANCRVTNARLARVLLTAEKALADNLALMRTAESLLVATSPKPTAEGQA